MTPPQKKIPIKHKVEAVLFSVGKKITLDEICRLCRSNRESVLPALQELEKDYEEKDSSLMLVEEGDSWKFSVRDNLISIVRKIVAETELTKTVMETLAVIAFKYPILQSDLIKIRTNKSYEHLAELEKVGYITRQKRGRTNLIKLTDKFFKYFDLTEEKLKDQFKDFESIARAIKEKEEEVTKIKDDQLKKARELKDEDEKIKKEIESLDEAGGTMAGQTKDKNKEGQNQQTENQPEQKESNSLEENSKLNLETFEAKPDRMISEEFESKNNLVVEREKLGELEIVDEQKKTQEEYPIRLEKYDNENNEEENNVKNEPEEIHEKKGIKSTPEMESKADEIAQSMIQGNKYNPDDSESEDLEKEDKKENSSE